MTDELVAEVPVRPWGVQVVASESGTGTDSNTVFVGLPAGRTYDNPEMLIVLSPTLERMLIELALGDEAYPATDRFELEFAHGGSGRRATRPPIEPPICWRRPRRCNICATARATAAPEAAATDRSNPGPGGLADRRAKRGRRLVVGQRQPPAPSRPRTSRRRRATA